MKINDLSSEPHWVSDILFMSAFHMKGAWRQENHFFFQLLSKNQRTVQEPMDQIRICRVQIRSDRYLLNMVGGIFFDFL